MLNQAVFLKQQLSFNLFNIFLSEIEDLPPDTQEKLYSELLDRDAQHELEEDAAIINWSEEVRYSFNFYCKVEKILKGSVDLIPSPSPSVKIQIMGGKVCLRCKGKTLICQKNF